MKKIILTLLLVVMSAGAFAHGGGLDGNGCHMNRSTGEYHCHRGNAAPQQQGLYGQPPPAPAYATLAAIDNTCYTGPRGGRYRIINGTKRYGC